MAVCAFLDRQRDRLSRQRPWCLHRLCHKEKRSKTMHGVASLLDHKHYQLVKDLWAELEREFAVSGVSVPTYPHVSYQVARRYNVKSLEPVLRRFVASRTSFQVRAGGVGIFPGPHPVLYIPVVRSPELTKFHEALWQDISSTGTGLQDYYHPAQWVPHITIGTGDAKKGTLSRIIHLLAEREFNWEMTVDNIALIYVPIVPLFGTRISIFAL
jgi:2'-5' RNA ligase